MRRLGVSSGSSINNTRRLTVDVKDHSVTDDFVARIVLDTAYCRLSSRQKRMSVTGRWNSVRWRDWLHDRTWFCCRSSYIVLLHLL